MFCRWMTRWWWVCKIFISFAGLIDLQSSSDNLSSYICLFIHSSFNFCGMLWQCLTYVLYLHTTKTLLVTTSWSHKISWLLTFDLWVTGQNWIFLPLPTLGNIGNFIKLGGSINYDMTMDWLNFGFHSSKGVVTTGPNMGKNSVLEP